jgi:outer membrane protein insertion porin family
MAAPSGDSGDDDGLFTKLKRADPKVLEERQKAVNERVHATFEKSQQRLADLLDQNSTLPTTISSITVLGAPNTRRGFLERIFNPLLSANRDRPYTQSEVLREVSIQAQKLSRFGM